MLTEKKVITDAEAISITFADERTVSATLKKYDGNTGIAIISVPVEEIGEETMELVEAAPLGNSHMMRQGSPGHRKPPWGKLFHPVRDGYLF